MIRHLESGLTINCPKGATYLRPADHQGLAEMYIAEAWNDTRAGSETENFIIAKLVETLDSNTVAPPIDTNYTLLPPPPLDPLLLLAIGGGALVVIVILAVVVRKR